jgi:hypothetical protein
MAQESGKVGDQNRGAGVNAGREAEHRALDHVDAGEARKYDLEHTGVIEGDAAAANRDQVDQDRPLNGVAKPTGGLEKNNDSRDPGPDLSSVEGVQSGGYAAQDSPEREPSLVSTAQSSQQD